jgi:hypothetical protein
VSLNVQFSFVQFLLHSEHSAEYCTTMVVTGTGFQMTSDHWVAMILDNFVHLQEGSFPFLIFSFSSFLSALEIKLKFCTCVQKIANPKKC